MSKPVENIFGLHYSGVNCHTKQEAARVANALMAKLRSLQGYNAVGFLALSCIDVHQADLTVAKNNKKVISPKWGNRVMWKNWHIHMSILACPGRKLVDAIAAWLHANYDELEWVYIKRDSNGVGEYARNNVNYCMRQSCVLRSFALGNPTSLKHLEEYLALVDAEAKQIGYRQLKITSLIKF